MAENPELQTIFMQEVIDVLKTQLISDSKDSIDSYDSGDISSRILSEINNIAV